MSSLSLLRHHSTLASNLTAGGVSAKLKSLYHTLATILKYLGYVSLAFTIYKWYLSRLSKKNKKAD